MTKTIFDKAAFEASIKNISEMDFDAPSGFGHTVYFDPEASEVIALLLGQSETPVHAYNNIYQTVLDVPANAIAQSVAEALTELADDIEWLAEGWQGTRWDGSNHIGVWADNRASDFSEKILGGYLDITTYWEPGDWFEPVMGELKDLWAEGKTAEQIIDEQDLGDTANGICDRDAAIKWLEKRIEEWVEEAEEDGE